MDFTSADNLNPYVKALIDEAEERFSVDSINMSYSEWVCRNTTLLGRPFSFEGYEFQKKIVDDLHPNLDCIKISQIGLALDLETKIKTSTGWTTMRDIQVGDLVFDESGKSCHVTYVSPVYTDRTCYEIEFDSGDTVVADADHRWPVITPRMFHPTKGFYHKTGRIPLSEQEGYGRRCVTTTYMMAKSFTRQTTSAKYNLFAVESAKPLRTKKAKLPIDPYFLGLWLGDGHSYSTRITMVEEDFKELQPHLKKAGLIGSIKGRSGKVLELKFELASGNQRFSSLYSHLSGLKLLANKHIPEIYLNSSPEQRLELLRGLMDTDGSITKKGRCSFYNTNPKLIEGVKYLVNSLGLKAHVRWRQDGVGKTNYSSRGRKITSKKPIADVSFVAYADIPVFKLNRKRKRLGLKSEGRSHELSQRKIVDIREVKSRPVRCITVDSPNHLFLCGEGLIPTHNTEVQIRKMLAFLKRNRGTSGIFSLPDENMHERISVSRFTPIIKDNKIFNTKFDLENKVTRTKEIKQFGQSFLYIVAAIESSATSINADIVMNDEVDLSDQKMIGLYSSRLQGSKFRIQQRFSTPTFPAFGIDANFNSSDQHQYLVRCDACSCWNHPEFTREFVHIPGLADDVEHLYLLTQAQTELFDMSQCYVKCQHCGARLDLRSPAKREWVAQYPSRVNSRGYQITPFVTDRLDLSYIFQQLHSYQKQEFLRGFHNTVLGKAYSDDTIQVSEDQIRDCFTEQMAPIPTSSTDVWVGIDVGKICHIVIGAGEDCDNIIEIRTVKVHDLVQTVEELMAKYSIRCGAIDRHPYEPTANEVFEKSGGRIVPVEYRGQKNLNLVFKDEAKEQLSHAQVNRTWFLDHLIGKIRKKSLKISGYTHQREIYVQHLRAMARNETPEKPAEWTKLNENDHYFHASAFCCLAPQLAQLIKLKSTADPRSMLLGVVADMKKAAEVLPGVSKKRLDRVHEGK